MAIKEKQEKTAVSKLRDRFNAIERSIKPSDKLKNILKKDKQLEQKDKSDKKVARPYNPRHELGI
jgi:hypothetical protein